MLLAAVKAGDIFEVVWVSLGAAVFISVSYSLVVVAGARSAEARRTGQGSAVAWGALGFVAFAAFAAAVVYGVHIMLSKG